MISVCPVCAAKNEGPSLACYTVGQAAAHFCTATRDAARNARLQDCIARLWKQGESQFRRCDQCGFGYCYPFVGGDEEFYSILHEQHGYPNWRWEYDLALTEASEIASHQSSPAVIDIGAGNGAFLQKLSRKWACFGVEGSSKTRNLLSNKGIAVCRHLAEAADAHPRRFHLVTMFQVLEHLADFAETLAMCRKIIHSGGRLVISVPDCDAMIAQERVTGMPDMPPSHINKWTPSSLGLALTEANFSVCRTVSEKASLATLKGAIYQKMVANAANSHSIGAKVYRIPSRRARASLLPVLAIPAALMLVRHWRYLLRGGSFAVVAHPVG
jgi:SAM-dependent methyltransferase